MLLTPIAKSDSFMNFGDSLILIPLISRPENWLHLQVSLPTFKLVLNVSLTSKVGIFTSLEKIAPISLATLYKDNKSGRLARTFKFKTSSSNPK